MILTSQLIICIIKITPTVRVLRLGSVGVICLFGVENPDDDPVAEGQISAELKDLSDNIQNILCFSCINQRFICLIDKVGVFILL